MSTDNELQQAPADAGPDFEAMADDIASSLNLLPETPEEPEVAPAAVAATLPADETTTPAAPTPAPTEAAGEKPAETTTEVPAPNTWRKEAKEAWASVPPIVREELVKREKDIQNYVDSVKVPVGIGNTMQKILEPYMEMFAKSNINVFDNYAATLQVQKSLVYGSPQEKMQVLQQLAQSAGITLDGTSLSAPADANQQYVAQMEARLAALEGSTKQVASTVQEARVAELETSIMAFLQDTKAHPYAQELTEDMTRIIQQGHAKDLEAAYQQAVVANPVTRQKSIEAETTKRLATKIAEDAAKVEAARKAASANVRSTASRRAPQPTGSIDDTLSEALAAINSRTH